MIHNEQFIMSRRPFAIDMSTVSGENEKIDDAYFFSGSCRAVWFRKEKGTVRACLGSLKLWAHYLDEPVNTVSSSSILSADLDGRYGGSCEGTWDGTRYWGARELDVMAKHLDVLKPMLAQFPQTIPSYDGWWSFR